MSEGHDPASALAEAQARVRFLEGLVEDLLGPLPDVPAEARELMLDVARPPLRAAYWQSGPWQCLRIEERTQGYERPGVFKDQGGRPRLRQSNAVERWMRWGEGIMEAFQVEPIPRDRPVRVVFLPGAVWTFMAWREVDRHGQLHPQDPDNAVKPSLDFAQTEPFDRKSDPRSFGAFVNDTQVVDLLVYRISQAGAPLVDRQAITRARSLERRRKRIPAGDPD